jgi:hypothetical protein
VSWKAAGDGGQRYFMLDGLGEAGVAVREKYLVVGNDPAMISAVLQRAASKADGNIQLADYAAGFRHSRERENFYRLTALVDQPNRHNESEGQPEFFSQNLASLSRVFSGIDSLSITMRHSDKLDTQTVRYRWSQ